TVCPAGVPYGRLLEQTRGQLARRAVRRGPARLLGEWALRAVFPHRERMHRMADLLRIGQTGPLGAFLRTDFARALMPRFAAQGVEMTPALQPRAARALDQVALPPGARLERRADALVFHPAGAAKARVGFFTSCVMEVMFPEVNREAVRLLLLAGAEVVVPHAQTCCGALHAAVPGVELVELPNSDWCCGSAGVYNLSHPELADAQLVAKLDGIAAAAPDVVIASNPGCLLHMRRGARARGMRVPMRHLV